MYSTYQNSTVKDAVSPLNQFKGELPKGYTKLSTDPHIRRAVIERDVRVFLGNGGDITVIPPEVNASYDQARKLSRKDSHQQYKRRQYQSSVGLNVSGGAA